MSFDIELWIRVVTEIIQRWLRGKAWTSGRVQARPGAVAIFHTPDAEDEKHAKQLKRILDKYGLLPRREVLPEQDDSKAREQILNVGNSTWVALLLVPRRGWSRGVQDAFHSLSRLRTDLVVLVAGYESDVTGLLNRYVYLQVTDVETSLEQQCNKALITASLERIQHTRRMDRTLLFLSTMIALLLCVGTGLATYVHGKTVGFAGGQHVGAEEARRLAADGIEKVEKLNVALVRRIPGNRPELLQSAEGDIEGTSAPCDFEYDAYRLRLVSVEFLDQLVMGEHKKGALCIHQAELGETQLVLMAERKFLGNPPSADIPGAGQLWNLLVEKYSELCRESNRKRGTSAVLASFAILPTGRNSAQAQSRDAEWGTTGTISQQPFIIGNRQLLIVQSGDFIMLDGHPVMQVEKLCRVPGERMCGVDLVNPSAALPHK